MAVAGDVVIKLAADYAEFKKGMEDSQQQLTKFGEQAVATGSKVEQMFGLIGKGVAAVGIGALINEVVQYADKIQKAAASVADLARQTGLTTSETQALQVLAAKTGDSFADLAKKGSANRDWLAQVTADAERLGLVMDSDVVQTLKRIQVESDEASKRLEVMFSGSVAGTKSWIAEQLERISADLATIGMQQGVIDKLIALGQMLGYGSGAGASGQFRIDALTDQVARREAELAQAQVPSQREAGQVTEVVPPDPAVVAAARKALDDARTLLGQAQDAAAKAAYGSATLDAKAITVVADRIKTGGGGGKTDEDYIQAQIDRYTALGKTAAAAYDTISKGQSQNIEDLKRSVTVQQQVDEIVAKQVARHQQVTDAQKKELYAAVDGYERQKAAAQKLLDVNIAAVETDKKYGDGTVTRAKLQKDLNDQLKTGRITTDDYNRSLKENSEAIEQSALAAQRYDDKLGSLGAGFEHAANAYARSNDLYSQGEQAFTGLTGAMTEGLKALEGQSSKTFGQIAADFANMLADMALRAAVSQAFKLLVSAASSSFGGGGVGVGSVSPGDWSDMLNNIPGLSGRASGGPVNQGQPYVVGERGPEFFVPAAAGNIVPNGAGGSGAVTVNVAMSGQESSMGAGDAVEFGRRLKQAVVATIQNEQRPGGTLYQRKSA